MYKIQIAERRTIIFDLDGMANSCFGIVVHTCSHFRFTDDVMIVMSSLVLSKAKYTNVNGTWCFVTSYNGKVIIPIDNVLPNWLLVQQADHLTSRDARQIGETLQRLW